MVTGWQARTIIHNVGAVIAHVDLYYWRCKRSVPLVIGGGGTPLNTSYSNIWTADLANMGVNAPSSGTALDPTDYGVTPFQGVTLPQYCQIYKKSTMKIDVNETVTLHQSRKLKKTYNEQYIQNQGMIGGSTEGIFIVFAGMNAINAPISQAVTLALTTNVNYTYRILESAAVTGGTQIG